MNSTLRTYLQTTKDRLDDVYTLQTFTFTRPDDTMGHFT